MRMAPILVPTVILGITALTTADEPQSRPAMKMPHRAAAETYWNRIQELISPESYTAANNKVDWWYDVMKQAHDAHMEFFCAARGKACGEVFVDKFGKGDPATDLLLLFADADVTAASLGSLPDQARIEAMPEKERRKNVAIAEWVNAVSEAQVRCFCRSPKLLRRYYRACVWSEQLFAAVKHHDALLTEYPGCVNGSRKVQRPISRIIGATRATS